METLIGVITKDGSVKTKDGRVFSLPCRGTDKEGYPEVLIDAKSAGGYGWMHRQSIKPFVGMECWFVSSNGNYGWNFEVIPENTSVDENQ